MFYLNHLKLSHLHCFFLLLLTLWWPSMQPADIATLINLRMTFLVGVWESLPLMSLPHILWVPSPAASDGPKKQIEDLDGEKRWQRKPTAALGQHSHSAAVGLTNCAERWTRSERDFTYGGEMVCTEGISFHYSAYQTILNFTVRDYFFLSFPILHSLSLSLSCNLLNLCPLYKAFTAKPNVLLCKSNIGAGGLCVPLIVIIWRTLLPVPDRKEVIR